MTDRPIELQTVLDRLGKLERQNRRLKRAGLAALIGVGALVLMGQTKPPLGFTPTGQIVEARKFVLKDLNGNVRGEWETSPDQKLVSLQFHDSDGTPRVSVLSFDLEGSSLILFGGKNGPSLTAVANPGATRLVLAGLKAIPRVELNHSHFPDLSYLAFSDAQRQVIWRAP
jgi:hypothetical protein